jgi:hypothetical protein
MSTCCKLRWMNNYFIVIILYIYTYNGRALQVNARGVGVVSSYLEPWVPTDIWSQLFTTFHDLEFFCCFHFPWHFHYLGYFCGATHCDTCFDSCTGWGELVAKTVQGCGMIWNDQQESLSASLFSLHSNPWDSNKHTWRITFIILYNPL